MYSIYTSWNSFLPMLWWNSDSEIYLCAVNSETWDHAQANFTLCCALEFCTCAFVFGCTPSFSPTTGHCSMCQASWHVIWLECGFDLPLRVDWGWGSLAFISVKFLTKATQNSCWSVLLLWLAFGFGLPVRVDGRWGSLALISTTLIHTKFWTKARQNFWWSVLLLQDDRMV
jgi:hypothetical protein